MPDGTNDRAQEIRAELGKLAPCENDPAKVTARHLARYLAAQAQTGWERLWVWPSEPKPSQDYLMGISLMTTQFAAAHALRALADAAPEVADEAARQIVDAWDDGGGVGEWIWEHHGANARQIADLAKELAPLTLPEPAGDQVTVSREDLRALLVWARMDGGFQADAAAARLSAAAEVIR